MYIQNYSVYTYYIKYMGTTLVSSISETFMIGTTSALIPLRSDSALTKDFLGTRESPQT